jgi:hypothetical protein
MTNFKALYQNFLGEAEENHSAISKPACTPRFELGTSRVQSTSSIVIACRHRRTCLYLYSLKSRLKSYLTLRWIISHPTQIHCTLNEVPPTSAFTFHYTALFQVCPSNYERSNYVMLFTVPLANSSYVNRWRHHAGTATLMTVLACGLPYFPGGKRNCVALKENGETWWMEEDERK